jgi:hypothetical protein
MIEVTGKSFPNLHAAFVAIEQDNGGHLIGTVYPGEPIDFETFRVPDAWEPLLAPAEAGLARLRACSVEDLSTFVIGEETEAEAIQQRQADLNAARLVMNDYFDGWQEERPWRPMSEYPWADFRDDAGKYHLVPGPRVDIRFANGHVVTAQYRGERTKGGGEAWAFWTDKGKWYGTVSPIAWRLAQEGTAGGKYD